MMAETGSDSIDASLWLGALHMMREKLVKAMDLTDLVPDLLSCGVIDDEQEEEIRCCEETKGKIKATRTLLTLVVNSKLHVTRFIEVLKDKIPWGYDMVREGVRNIQSGEWDVHTELDVGEFRRHLHGRYLRDMCTVQPAPQENLSFRVDDEEMMMTPDFKAYVVDLNSKKNRQKLRSQQRTAAEPEAYSQVMDSCVEEVFLRVGDGEVTATNLQPTFIRLIGDAGVGKTTLVQRLTWLWAKEKSTLSTQYKLLFFLSVRKMKEGRLMDNLSRLNLLPPSCSPSPSGDKSTEDRLGRYLNKPENAKQVLFILDGTDERDMTSEMDQLISGELYPGCTVLMTARPEAKCLKSLSKLSKIKITLFGTDKDTVDKYMKEAVIARPEGEWTAEDVGEWADFQTSYEEKLSDTDLLCIPLYLTLICAVFKADVAAGLKCTKLQIPKTTTELFNSFMYVLISRWFHKIGHPQKDLKFGKSPLDPESTMPCQFKWTLYFLGRLCYKDLMAAKSSYEFSEGDASANMLDMKVILDCGLFTVGRSESAEFFFPIHKQIQEYLSGLYLSYEGTREPLFHELLLKEQNQGKSLSQVMRDHNIIKLVQFACGLSADFHKELLQFATAKFCLLKYALDGSMDIYYEAALFAELNADHLAKSNVHSLKGVEEFQNYLSNASIHYVDNSELYFLLEKDVRSAKLGFYQKSLSRVASVFETSLSSKLLAKLYGVPFSPVAGQNCYELARLETPASTTTLDLCLDQLQTELLSHVCIQGVNRVIVDHPNTVSYVDLPQLLQTFSHLKELEIDCLEYVHYTASGESEGEKCTGVTRVELKSVDNICMSKSHLECLLMQDKLEDLKLVNFDIFKELAMSPELLRLCWRQLDQLDLCTSSILSASDVSAYSCLVRSTSPSLRHHKLLAAVAHGTQAELAETLRRLAHIETLHFNLLGQAYFSTKILASCLQYMKSLKSLESSFSLPIRVKEFSDAMISIKQLTCLKMYRSSGNTVQLLSACLPQMPQLQQLLVSDITVNSDQITQLHVAMQSLENLKALEISPQMNDENLCQVLVNCLPVMSKLEKLRIVSMYVSRDLKTELCEALQSLKMLEHLLFTGQKDFQVIGDVLAHSLPEFVNLKYLELSDECIHDDIIYSLSEALKSLTQLKHLRIAADRKECSHIDQLLVSSLSHLSNISTLDLHDVTVQPHLVSGLCKELGALDLLEHLDLYNLTEACAVQVVRECVPNLPKLRLLCVNANIMTDSQPDVLECVLNSSSLKDLYLCGAPFKYPPFFMDTLCKRGVKVSKS